MQVLTTGNKDNKGESIEHDKYLSKAPYPVPTLNLVYRNSLLHRTQQPKTQNHGITIRHMQGVPTYPIPIREKLCCHDCWYPPNSGVENDFIDQMPWPMSQHLTVCDLSHVPQNFPTTSSPQIITAANIAPLSTETSKTPNMNMLPESLGHSLPVCMSWNVTQTE